MSATAKKLSNLLDEGVETGPDDPLVMMRVLKKMHDLGWKFIANSWADHCVQFVKWPDDEKNPLVGSVKWGGDPDALPDAVADAALKALQRERTRRG